MNKEILKWISNQIKYRTYLLSRVNKPRGPICTNSNPVKEELKILNQIKKELEEKEAVLDDAERDYLKSVLKPFRNEVYCVFKSTSLINKQGEYICAYVGQDVFVSPQFKKGTMYKNMELDKKYTLEELGIKY